MRPLAACRACNIAIKQLNGACVLTQLARNEIEQRCLAGSIRPDNQSALARLDLKIDIAGDPQTAERFAQPPNRERGHGRRSAAGVGMVLGRLQARTADRNSRATPGTRPSAMNT